MNYDSSGLMAQIQALIAAPNSTRTRTNNKHPYFKRPGRGHNHDTCDACHEAGDLLCCDTCSASFHLLCVNPPLAYEQIPSGDWRCHRCLCCQSDGTEETAQKKHLANHRRGKKRPAASSAGREPCAKKPALITNPDTQINGREGGVVLKFFDQAVEMAKKMNPEQFTLPKYLMEYGAVQFPGSARPVSKKGNAKANKQIIETENGMVPSPIIVCFVCEISCRKGPMIKCDGCSAFFHFECVNPPLTGVPQGRWLCHLHPEPTLENKSLKSLSFTERVRLYDYAKQPIDPVQVALRFVTKTQRAKHSYFRTKVPVKGKDYTLVPGPIVKCYTEEENEENLPAWPTFEEVTLKRTEEFHEKTINTKQNSGEASDDMNPLELLAQIASKELDEKSKPQNMLEKGTIDSYDSSFRQTAFSQKHTEAKDPRVAVNYDKTFECIKKEKLSAQDENLLEGLDLDAILQLAAQKMRELHCNETMDCANGFGENSRSDGSSSSHVNPRNELIENRNNFGIGIDLSETCADVVSDTQNSKATDTQVEIPVPYIKFLILNANKEVLFKEGQVMIGRGTAELNVHEYFACQSVTDEHCCVYFDYVRGKWELINYSPNGTIVNKVPYGCDRKAQPRSKLDLLYAKKVKEKPNGIQQPSSYRNLSNETSTRCSCNNNRSYEESMDGSAYLDVGSRIQIGCVRIVVIDTGSESKWVPREHLVYNSITKLPFYKKNVDSQDASYDDSQKNTSESGSETETIDDADLTDQEQLVNGKVKEPIKKRSTNAKSRRVSTRPTSTRGRGRGRGRGRAGATISRRKQSNEENVSKDATVRRKTTRGRRKKSDCVKNDSVVLHKTCQKAANSPSDFCVDPNVLIKQEVVSNSTVLEPTHLMGSSIEDHDYVGPTSSQTSHVNRRDIENLQNIIVKATNIR